MTTTDDPRDPFDETDATTRLKGNEPITPPNPDDQASDDPMVNINYNLVQLIKLLHAADERRDRHIRETQRQNALDLGALTRQFSNPLWAINGELATLNHTLSTNHSLATRAKRWLHKVTSP